MRVPLNSASKRIVKTWVLRWGSSGFFPPGRLGVGLTASGSLRLRAATGKLSLRETVASAALSLGLEIRVGFRVTDIQVVTQ